MDPNFTNFREIDFYLFDDFVETSILLTQNAMDISIFSHQSVGHQAHCFAGILQINPETNYGTISLHKYDKNQNSWILVRTEHIINPSKVFSLSYSDGTLLIVAHKSILSKGMCEGITVFILDDNMRLRFVQTLETATFADVSLWESDYNIFLAVAYDHITTEGSINVESNSPIYKWKGNHFDIHQYIPTSNAKKIVSFHIGSSMFLAVANHQNNYGAVKIFSEIFKYDAHKNKFMSYQKLASDGATDITFFCFQEGTYEESFLIITNDVKFNGDSQSVVYKYEKNYFVPFQEIIVQAVTRWFQFAGQPKSFILLAISVTNKMNIFQYNGWNFINIPVEKSWVQVSDEAITKKCFLNGDSTLAISDETRTFIRFTRPIFKYVNDIEQLKSEMYSWCDDVRYAISCSRNTQYNFENNANNFLSSLRQNSISDGIYLDKNIQLNSAFVEKIETISIIADDMSLDNNIIQNINNLFSLFNFQISSLKSLKQILPKIIIDDGPINMDSLHADNVEFECNSVPCELDNIEMVILNGEDVGQYQREVLYTESINDFYDHIEFLDLVVENNLIIENINEKSIESISLLMQQVAKMNGVFVNRNIYLANGLSVNGLLDNVKLSDEAVLLKDGDQILKGSFKIPQIKTTLLEAEQINDLTFEKMKEIVMYENKTINTPYALSQIVVENAFIEELINKISFRSLLTDTLKLSGDQNLNGAVTISNLDTLDISVSSITENIVNQLITIDEGFFEINQDVQFDNINLDSIFIGERLNEIPVVDNELSVVLVNSPKMQRVTGDKIFDNVELMGPINLQGRINIPSLERKNPVTMIEQPLILLGNFIIQGNVSIERFLTCDNLSKIGDRSSITELQQRGLKLSERNIPMPLIFSQPLEVKNINCDAVNGLKPTSWISMERNDIITITGRKMLSKNINIRGSCSIVDNVNNVNPMILDLDVMKTFGDQLISGKIFFNSMTTKSLSCQNISFAGRPMDKILMVSGDHTIPGETVINFGAKVDKIMSTNVLEVSGTISGHHIQEMIIDTIMLNSPKVDIFSSVVLTEPLNIKHLELEEIFSSNTTQMMYSSAIWNREVLFTELYIKNPINVQNIMFDTSIAGISKSDFGNIWLLTEGDQVLHGNQIISNINCFNDIYLETGKVNNMHLSELFNNAIRISDNIFLKMGIFKNGINVKGNLVIEGSLNNLHIPEDLVLRNPYNYENIFGHKIFKNAQITGNVKTGYINSLSMEHICLISRPDMQQYLPTLHINGSLYLHEEPLVNMLHNVDIENLMKNIWFSDTSTKLYGMNHFKKIKTTKSVEGRISLCGIDLYWLSENYLSLSRDQDITAAMKISTIFGNIVNVFNESSVHETINGVMLEDFYQNTLHTLGYQQIISPLDFDVLSVNDNLNLLGSINGLNLRSGVFRVTVPNNAKQKYFTEMEIRNLKLNSDYLKNVDLKMWADSVINKNDIINYVIKGNKYFKTWESKDMSISRYINGQIMPMNRVMSKQNAQTLSRKVAFITKEKPTIWNSINVAKMLNDIDVTNAFKSLLLNNSDMSTFTSPKVFMSHIIANDGHIDGLVNNVNFSSVVLALSSTEFFRDFNNEFKSMEQFSQDIYKNFKKRTYQIKDWKISQVIKGEIQCMTIISSSTQDMITHLILAVKNFQGDTEMHFYIWNSNTQTFFLDPDVTRYTFNEGIRNLFSLKLGKEPVIFVEIGESSIQSPPYRSDLFTFSPNFGISLLEYLNSNLTTAAASWQAFDKNCILISYLYGLCKLYCQEEHQNRSYLQLRQTIDNYNNDEIDVMIISDVLHVVLAGNNGTEIFRWMGNEHGYLALLQTLPPSCSLSTISWKHNNYLALAERQSAHVYLFNTELQRFESHRDIRGTGGTKKVQFVTLPNFDLGLTVLIPPSHFSLYLYKLGSEFQHKLNHMASSHISSMTNIRIGNEHMIALIGHTEISILKSIYKPKY